MTFERWGVPVALGDRRVLHPGMLRWLRALGWMVLSGFVCALAFALPHSGMSALLPDTEPAAAGAALVGAVVARSPIGCWCGSERRVRPTRSR